MTIAQAAEQYIQHKRSLGMKFESPAVVVRSFARAAGNAQADDLDAGQVRAFLFGRGTSPQTAIQKWSTLRGLYRFALARGIATASPLPVRMPAVPTVTALLLMTPSRLRMPSAMVVAPL